MNGIRVTIWVKTCNIYSVNRQRYLTCVIVCISVKVYTDKNVIESAKDRIGWLYDEFENVVVNVSGGKDSTVLFHLALEVARDRDRLPLKIQWIDQEAEWQSTVDIIEKWMTHEDTEPYWFQIPMKITNATSDDDDFLNCWYPDEDWMRERHEISIKENNYGTERFSDLYGAIAREEHLPQKTVMLSGVRSEESPRRHMGITRQETYKGRTWGRQYQFSDKLFTMYPLYDLSYSDIWKYIHDNNIEYNDVYDFQFKKGRNIQNMRVSNLHHETAVDSLWDMAEFEPETHDALVDRMDGIHAATSVGEDEYFPDDLPHMFRDWREYRNFLLAKLVDNEEHYKNFKRVFRRHDLQAEHLDNYPSICRTHCRAILANDHENESILPDLKREFDNNSTQKIRDYKIEWLKQNDKWEEIA